MSQATKVSLNGEAFKDCPKCQGEDSLYVSAVLKWGKINKWQYAIMCTACNYERKAK